jgi:hypothetical protein
MKRRKGYNARKNPRKPITEFTARPARVEHRCFICKKSIQVGQLFYDGKNESNMAHVECADSKK